MKKYTLLKTIGTIGSLGAIGVGGALTLGSCGNPNNFTITYNEKNSNFANSRTYTYDDNSKTFTGSAGAGTETASLCFDMNKSATITNTENDDTDIIEGTSGIILKDKPNESSLEFHDNEEFTIWVMQHQFLGMTFVPIYLGAIPTEKSSVSYNSFNINIANIVTGNNPFYLYFFTQKFTTSSDGDGNDTVDIKINNISNPHEFQLNIVS